VLLTGRDQIYNSITSALQMKSVLATALLAVVQA
jgi:hypothetical protein